MCKLAFVLAKAHSLHMTPGQPIAHELTNTRASMNLFCLRGSFQNSVLSVFAPSVALSTHLVLGKASVQGQLPSVSSPAKAVKDLRLDSLESMSMSVQRVDFV